MITDYGKYSVCVQNIYGCINCSDSDFIATDLQSITQDSKAIILYPNPTQNSFTILFTGQWKVENAQMKIYDLTGNLILEQHIDKSTIINHNSLPDGIYFYQVINDTGEIAKGKFVVESK